MTAKNSTDTGLTEADREFLTTKLSSKLWRLNNLYTIKDKDGKKSILKLNSSQNKVLTKYRHNKKIILKSRQQGISTLFVAYYLDSCIFTEGYEAGIQSYGRDESEKLSQRAELMWDELDERVKTLVGLSLNKVSDFESSPTLAKNIDSGKLFLEKNNSSGLYFSNGSILKIGNFRGDTLQALHVSELGKIAKRSPEKAKELQTGAFQAVSVKNKITIESTAEGKSGLLYEMWCKAEQKQLLKQPLTPLDYEAIFLPWYDDPDCQIFTEVDIPPELDKYFTKLEDTLNIVIDDTYKWWYVIKKDELGDYMGQEYPSTAKEAFEQSIDGMYYKNEFPKLKLISNAYDENLKVNMAFDLGMNDDFSIGFVQNWYDTIEEVVNGKVITTKLLRSRIIGEYRNSGFGLEHYAEVCAALKNKLGWDFGVTYVPHDIVVRELIAGKTRWDALIEYGFKPVLVTKHKVVDGIECVRQFLGEVEIDEECTVIIGAIQNYRKKFDKQLQVFLDSPLHDEWSHPADMIRYMAMGLKHSPPHEIYRENLHKKRRVTIPSGYDV
jgi:hypothetical protein